VLSGCVIYDGRPANIPGLSKGTTVTIKTAAASVAIIGALALGVSPALGTPAQTRQIHALKATIAKDNKAIAARNFTIATRNKTIAADGVTIGTRNATIAADGVTIGADSATITADNATIAALRADPPFVVDAASVSSLTPVEAWALVPYLYADINGAPGWNFCSNTTVYGDSTSTYGTTNGDGSGYAATDYDFSATTWFGQSGC